MNLKRLKDEVAGYRQNRVSTKIGKSLAEYYRTEKSLKKEQKSLTELKKEEKENAERTE